jgi:hypothetical protein
MPPARWELVTVEEEMMKGRAMNSGTSQEHSQMRTTIFRSSAMTLAFAAAAATAYGQADTALHTTAMSRPNVDSSLMWTPAPEPRAGEQHEAPYLDRDGGPRNAGSVVGTGEVSGIIEAADRVHYELGENVYVTLPKGTTTAVGDRFYTFTLDTSFGSRGQIVVPTGVVQVVRVGVSPEATTARIVQEFGAIQLHQGILPLTTSPGVSTLTPVEHGVATKVLWVNDDAVLPTLQYYVVLGVGDKEGIHPGDRFTLYRPAVPMPESPIVLPSVDIATAEVVRVNKYGSTAVVVSHDQPAIHTGIAARLTAQAQ